MTRPGAQFEQDVFPAELQEIAARRKVLGRPGPPPEGDPGPDKGLVGLALSGGGIRSATFSLGAIQALAQHGVFKAFDYLSTVSGGGFVGGFVSSLMNDPRVGSDGESFPLRAATGAAEAPAVRHVRNSANYLAPGGLLDQIRIPALFVRGVLMNALALVPYLIFAAMLTQFYYSENLDDWVTGAMGAVAVFLFVMLLLLTKLVNRWSSWTARNRYEGWLATSFLLLVVLVLSPWLLSLVDSAKDLTPRSLAWKLRELLTWRVLAAFGVAAVLAGAAQFSRTAARLRSTLLLYAVGMLGPIVVFAGYLLLCVFYLEPKWLDTAAADLSRQAGQELRETGQLPDELTNRRPEGVAEAQCTPRKVPVPYAEPVWAWLQGRHQVEAWTSCGAYHLRFADPPRVWLEAERVPLKPEDVAEVVGDLDKGRVPPLLYYELFQDGPTWYYFERRTNVGVRIPGEEWSVAWSRGGDTQYLVAVTLFDEWLYMFWEQPIGTEELPTSAAMPPFGHLAHVHKEAEGAWRLTSAGRNFKIRELHDRTSASWDLSWDLDRGIVSDPLRRAFIDKGGLPGEARVERSGSGRSERWLVYPPPPQATPGGGSGEAEPPVEIRAEDEGYSTTRRPPFMHREMDSIFLAVGLFWLVFYNGLFLNVNASAFHGFYRDRLSRAYLVRHAGGDSREFVSNDRQRLSELNQPGTCAPYHLVNVALNLNGMTEPDMRGRQCDFFVFSKHFTGSPRTGYCRTADLERLHRHMNLGTAMAISGAAASPNAGTATLKPLVFLLTLLNVRLGYWLPHPARVSAKWWSPARLRLLLGVGSLYLWREAIGGVSSRAPYVNLSDGGHIENLGIYPLLRRRCKVIVAIDGEEDPQVRFGSLMQLMMFARIDLGTNIYFDLDQIRPATSDNGRSRSHFAVGRIHYGGGEEGWLWYVKASMTGDEGPLLRDYWESHPDFPHQSTANQFFNERQFEMYRALGYHIAEELIEQLQGRKETSIDPRARRETLEALLMPGS